MKKIFSIILAFALAVSVSCIIPVSANVIGSPYNFYDFETSSEKPEPASNTTVEIVDTTAYGGSAKCLQITENAEKFQSDFAFSPFEIKSGDVVTMTFKYKLATKLKAEKAEFALMIYDGVKYHTQTYTISQPEDTENWYTATLTANDFTNTFTPGAISLRFGTMGNRMEALDGGDKTVYFDDFCIKREQPTSYLYDFEDNTVPTEITSSLAWTYSIVANPTNNNNKALQTVYTTNDTLRLELAVNKPWTKADSEKMTFSTKVFVKESKVAAGTNALKIRFKLRDTASTYAVGFVDLSVDMTNTSTWQEITFTRTNTGSTDTFYNCTIEIADTDGSIFLFDDIKYEFERKAYAIPSVDSGVTAAMDNNGVVTLSGYSYQEKATANPTGIDASAYKILMANGGVIKSGKLAEGIQIPASYRDSALRLEIVPISSVGYLGKSVATAVQIAPSTISVTSITKEDSNIKVSAATDIANAKLIFVKYDANNKMLNKNFDNVVTLSANTTTLVPIPDGFTDGNVKVMLWQDFVNCAPLSDSIE